MSLSLTSSAHDLANPTYRFLVDTELRERHKPTHSLRRIVGVTMAENRASNGLPIACEPHKYRIVRAHLPAFSATLNTPMCRAVYESV
jgi:hypothetical protein